jgi:integrase
MSHQFLFNPYILDNLPAPATGFDVVQDTSEPKLRMYITSRGIKSFFVRKRINGRDRRIIIGNYPAVDIENARDRVHQILETAHQKPKQHRKKIGFRKFSDIYLLRHVRRAEEAKAKLSRAMLRHLNPLFDMNLQDIKSDDILGVLENISGPAVRNRMHELLQSIFNYGADGGYIKQNPMEGIAKVAEHRRVRPLNRAGFSRLLMAIRAEGDEVMRAAFLMLIYGFAPKAAILSMQWRDLDFNHYMWGERPLSDAAAVLLRDLPQDGRWVFPGRGGRHLTDPRTSWHKIATRARIENLTMDDVYKFMKRQLPWASDTEVFRQNMNNLINELNV